MLRITQVASQFKVLYLTDTANKTFLCSWYDVKFRISFFIMIKKRNENVLIKFRTLNQFFMFQIEPKWRFFNRTKAQVRAPKTWLSSRKYFKRLKVILVSFTGSSRFWPDELFSYKKETVYLFMLALVFITIVFEDSQLMIERS